MTEHFHRLEVQRAWRRLRSGQNTSSGHFWYCCSTVSQIEPQNDEVALGQMKVYRYKTINFKFEMKAILCALKILL